MDHLGYRSQQELLHEERMVQAQRERDARAQEWDVEKMELRSRIDMELEEKARARKLSRIDSVIEGLERKIEDGEISGQEIEYQNLLLSWKMKRLEAEAGVRGADLRDITPKAVDPMDRLLQGLLTGKETSAPAGATPGVDSGAAVALGQERVAMREINTGKLVTLPANQVAEAEASGEFMKLDLTKPVEHVKFKTNPVNPFAPKVRYNPFNDKYITEDGEQLTLEEMKKRWGASPEKK